VYLDEYGGNDPHWQLPFAQGSAMDFGIQDYNNDGYINMADLQLHNQTVTDEYAPINAALQAQQQQNLVNQQQANYLNAALGNLNTGGSLWGGMLGGGMLGGDGFGGSGNKGMTISGPMSFGDFNLATGQCDDPSKTFVPGQGCVSVQGAAGTGTGTTTGTGVEDVGTGQCGEGFYWNAMTQSCEPKIEDQPLDCGEGYIWSSELSTCVPEADPNIDPGYEDDPVQTSGQSSFLGGIGPSVEAGVIRSELENMVNKPWQRMRSSWGPSRWGRR
jgi:hypothetical protein